jgi:hypothetical protein
VEIQRLTKSAHTLYQSVARGQVTSNCDQTFTKDAASICTLQNGEGLRKEVLSFGRKMRTGKTQESTRMLGRGRAGLPCPGTQQVELPRLRLLACEVASDTDIIFYSGTVLNA